MSSRSKTSSGPSRELRCSRCFKRESCIQCCGTRFCLRHFHTSDHASEHPSKAFVMNKPAFDEQLPAFQKMWREAFQSVAEDVERISSEVGKRVAEDPLASIGMTLPENLSAAKGKSSGKSREGASSSTAAKRRQTEEKATQEVDASDPFTRRRIRPKTYWAVGSQRDSTQKVGASSSSSSSTTAAAGPAASARKGEYRCEACSSEDTSFDIIGGASDGSRKGETFGKKDAPELVLRVSCHACGNSWIEER